MSHAPSRLYPSQMSTTSRSTRSTCTPVRLSTRRSTRPLLTSSSHGDHTCANSSNVSFGLVAELTLPTLTRPDLERWRRILGRCQWRISSCWLPEVKRDCNGTFCKCLRNCPKMQECKDASTKLVDLIWVHTDESVDPAYKNMRARLCAREYKTKRQGKVQRALLASQLFSPMPPHEAVKVLVSNHDVCRLVEQR